MTLFPKKNKAGYVIGFHGVRDSVGRFRKDYSRQAIYVLLLGLMAQYLLFFTATELYRIRDAERDTQVREAVTEMKEYVRRGNTLILEATLGRMSEMEQDRLETNQLYLDLASSTIDVTGEAVRLNKVVRYSK